MHKMYGARRIHRQSRAAQTSHPLFCNTSHPVCSILSDSAIPPMRYAHLYFKKQPSIHEMLSFKRYQEYRSAECAGALCLLFDGPKHLGFGNGWSAAAKSAGGAGSTTLAATAGRVRALRRITSCFLRVCRPTELHVLIMSCRCRRLYLSSWPARRILEAQRNRRKAHPCCC